MKAVTHPLRRHCRQRGMIDARRLQSRLDVIQDGMIGPNTLRALFARMGASPSFAGPFGRAASEHFRTYGILDSGLRLAHFMGQTAHESDGFRTTEEYASGAAYEGRKDLGNTHPGDGRRYKGRGLIMITGRANYRRVGALIGVDLEAHPERAEEPEIAVHTACQWWADNGCNPLADADNITGLTKRINGGLNGLSDRKVQLSKAKELVGL